VIDTRDRRPIGQLLGRALRAFRIELYQRAVDAGHDDIREAHLQVFGVLDWRGTRLTDLAARANMTPPAMAELVDELQAAGYLERRADPSDGRAKLIRPTRKGRRAIAAALRAVHAIEGEYGLALGAERFEALRDGLESLIDHPPTQHRGSRPTP
jgi:DNA-binding MarR family transcriptional regulator